MCFPCLMKTNKEKYALNKVLRICVFCKKEQMISKSVSLTSKFCSKKCMNSSVGTWSSGKWSAERTEKHSKTKTKDKIRRIGEYSCNKCEKKFNSNTSLRSHKSYCSISEKKQETSCEECKSTFESMRSLKIHKMLLHTDEKIKIERASKISKKRVLRSYKYVSKKEIIFFNELKKIFTDAESQKRFDGIRHAYDVFIPSFNIVIEYDGNYWHGKDTSKFKEFDLERIKIQWINDNKFYFEAFSKNIRMIRVWETEADKFLEEIKNEKNVEDYFSKKLWTPRSL